MSKMIEELVKFMEEELDGACDYIDSALKYKLDNKMYSDYLCKLSEEELKHAMSHHDWAVKTINEIKATGVVVPEKMMWKYEQEHEEFIDKMNEIKIKITTFKGI